LRYIFVVILCGYGWIVQAGAQTEFDYELDAYYSNVSWTTGLSNQAIPVVDNLQELEIYKTILKDSLTPDFILLEASINPMPIAGVLIRKQFPSLYVDGRSSGAMGNMVSSVTAGFDEPYALSLFTGRVLKFAPPKGMTTIGDNKGYIGYLFSLGGHHIQQNKLIRDNWLEVEWKVKGQRETELQYLSWSFRGGAKFHSHPEISDTFMLGVRRDRIDYQQAEDAFLRNLGVDYQVDMLQHNFKVSKQILLVDKHWPLQQGTLTVSLGLGVIWQTEAHYKGSLASAQDKWTLILRPNIRF